jgi:hypothetical protein
MVIRYVTINSEGDEVAQSEEIPGTRETGLEPARKLSSILRPTDRHKGQSRGDKSTWPDFQLQRGC